MLESIVKTPLFILTASIGYGKTTAVRNYLNEHREAASIWFAFGANEMDEMWTWEKMRLTLKKSGIPVLQTMAALELPQTFQERLLFINILQRGFEKPTVLVLDNYQEYNGKYLNQLIETLVYEEIPNFHIVLISRVSPEILGGITHLLRTSVFEKMESADQEILTKMSAFDYVTKEQAAFITKRGIATAASKESSGAMGLLS